jgi:hypothetical protein
MNSGRKDVWGQLRWMQSLEYGRLPPPDHNDYQRYTFMAATYDLTDNSSPYGK